MRYWWDELSLLGPDYGYFPNPIKACLIVKPSLVRRAKTLLYGTDIVISDLRKCHLGSAIGSEDFMASYVRGKVASWVSKIENSTCAVKQKMNKLKVHLVLLGVLRDNESSSSVPMDTGT